MPDKTAKKRGPSSTRDDSRKTSNQRGQFLHAQLRLRLAGMAEVEPKLPAARHFHRQERFAGHESNPLRNDLGQELPSIAATIEGEPEIQSARRCPPTGERAEVPMQSSFERVTAPTIAPGQFVQMALYAGSFNCCSTSHWLTRLMCKSAA
jgi:hypothetical protein